ncbi:MAG: DUF1659 domain-containing protein [Selenomonas sp.]|uniref:DUF1659 domain-containing protein n=1 Tax=Selenomonas sp. TaxID=2053611 RepID=UPI0025F64B55|nr:DUF1659 domain-containing protein [Selenomonas sp.]MCR5757754.1 DUF1659 domain-containing protein [Selenomonas sp.]
MRSKKATTLKITRILGSDSTGKDTFGYLNFAHVNPEIADDDLMSIGTKLGNLQSLPVDAIGRVDSCQLMQEH